MTVSIMAITIIISPIKIELRAKYATFASKRLLFRLSFHFIGGFLAKPENSWKWINEEKEMENNETIFPNAKYRLSSVIMICSYFVVAAITLDAYIAMSVIQWRRKHHYSFVSCLEIMSCMPQRLVHVFLLFLFLLRDRASKIKPQNNHTSNRNDGECTPYAVEMHWV